MLPQMQFTWQIRQEDVAVGAAISGTTTSREYKWMSYNVDTGKWKLIADWNGGNWAGWSDDKGTYWLHAEARNTQTKEPVAEKKLLHSLMRPEANVLMAHILDGKVIESS